MVIDSEPTKEAVKPSLTDYKDTVTQKAIMTMSLADVATQTVADNIANVNIVASRIYDIINVSTNVDAKITTLLSKTYNSNTDTPVDVMNKAIKLFNSSVLTDINRAVQLTDDITKLSSMDDTLLAIEGMETILTRIDNNLSLISNVGAAIDNVNVVAGLKTTLEKVVSIQDKLVEIYNRMTELKTIYEYLPEILVVHNWVKEYVNSRDTLGFTDDEFYSIMCNIFDNLSPLLDLNTKIDDALELKQTLDDSPTLVANIKAQLDALESLYTTHLTDNVAASKRELQNFVTDQLLTFIKAYMANIAAGAGGAGGVVGNTTAETLAAIKQGYGIVLTRDLTNDILTVSVDKTTITGNNVADTIGNISEGTDIKLTKAAGNASMSIAVDTDSVIKKSLANIKKGEGIVITKDVVNNTITLSLDDKMLNSKNEVPNFDTIVGTWVITDEGIDASATKVDGWNNTAGWAV